MRILHPFNYIHDLGKRKSKEHEYPSSLICSWRDGFCACICADNPQGLPLYIRPCGSVLLSAGLSPPHKRNSVNKEQIKARYQVLHKGSFGKRKVITSEVCVLKTSWSHLHQQLVEGWCGVFCVCVGCGSVATHRMLLLRPLWYPFSIKMRFYMQVIFFINTAQLAKEDVFDGFCFIWVKYVLLYDETR